MNATSRDFIAELDAAIGCQQCGQPLGNSPSNDFCAPECQSAWSAAHAEDLSVYDEPDDLPVHVDNLVELHSPETCVACVTSRTSPAWLDQTAFVHDWERRRRSDARRLYLNDRVVGVTPDGEVVGRQADGRVAAVTHITIRPRIDHLEAALRQAGRAAEPPEEWIEDWIERFSGVPLADWQRNLLRGQYERWELTTRRSREELTRTMAAFAPLAEQVGSVAADAATALQLITEGLAPPKPPADPRERALQLRRNRNTGPSTSSRAPRAINPRRSR